MEKKNGKQNPTGKDDEKTTPKKSSSSGDEVEAKKKSPEASTSKPVDGDGEMPKVAKARSGQSEVASGEGAVRNNLRHYRIENMMSKAERARKAGLSVLTVARIEKGYGCRMDTKRKILKALGLKLVDRRMVFEDE